MTILQRITSAALALIIPTAAQTLAASPLNLTVIGRATLTPRSGGYFNGLFVHDDRLFFLEGYDRGSAGWETVVHIYDVSDPTAPVVISEAAVDGRLSDMHGTYYSNGLLYFATQGGGRGLHIWDVRDSSNPVPLGTLDPRAPTLVYGTNGVHNLRKSGDYLYLLPNGGDPDLVVVDIRDPALPRLVSEFQLYPDPGAAFCHDLSVFDGRGFASFWDDGTYVFDLSDPTVIPLPVLRTAATGPNTHSAWATPDLQHLVTCHELPNEPVRTWDMNPTPFAELATWRSQETSADNIVHDVMVVGQHAYISHYGEGFRILDLSNLSAPVEVGSFQSGAGCGGNYCDGIAQWVEDGLIYYMDMSNGLYVFQFDLPHETPVQILAVKSGAGQDVALDWNHTGESQYSVRQRQNKTTLNGQSGTDVDGVSNWTDSGAVSRAGSLFFYTVNGPYAGTP